MPAQWVVEVSPSNRAACKVCKEKIEKGALRWCSISGEEGDRQFKSNFHVDCLKLPKAGIDFASVKGMSAMTADQQAKFEQAYEAAKERAANPVKRKKSHPKLEVEEGSKKQKRDETGKAVSDDPVVQKYQKMKISELKEYLKLNKMLTTGTKDVLVSRCVDGEKNGRFEGCPLCSKGQLRLNEKSMVSCGGYYDESISMRLPCTYEVQPSEAKREKWLVPGVDEHPDEENTEERTNNSDEVSVDDLEKLKDKFKDLPEDTQPRELCAKLVEAAQELGLKMPTDDKAASVRAGAALMSSRDEDGSYDYAKAFLTLRADVGTVDAAKAAEKKELAKAPKAKVEANDLIANTLDELGTLEAKFQDSPNFQFTVRALKKAAIAIRGIDFEIKSGNQVVKGPQKIAGVGKGTGQIIDELLTSGKCARLEELRERAEEQGI